MIPRLHEVLGAVDWPAVLGLALWVAFMALVSWSLSP